MKTFKEYSSGSRLKNKTSDWEGRARLSKKVRQNFWKSFKKQKKEELGPDADAGDYVDDFRKSDAPQFKGKTDKKIQKMAIAAYLSRKGKK